MREEARGGEFVREVFHSFLVHDLCNLVCNILSHPIPTSTSLYGFNMYI